MGAEEVVRDMGGPDDFLDPNHYENRLLVDIGEEIGCDEADFRRAMLDEHAEARFEPLEDEAVHRCMERVRELLDVGAILKALTAEVSSFSAMSVSDSVPRLFLKWADEHMADHKHLVFEDELCANVKMTSAFALALFEFLFLGGTAAKDVHRGVPVSQLFKAKADDNKEPVAEADDNEEPVAARRKRLVERLLSPAVQLPTPADADEEPARLSADEVAETFKRHVPGVKELLYRDQPGNYSLQFICGAYQDGFRAFKGSPVHDHYMWLMRLVVHHGHADKPGSARHLRQIAEAFQDCQAVQARVVERVGLEVRGVSLDFRGSL